MISVNSRSFAVPEINSPQASESQHCDAHVRPDVNDRKSVGPMVRMHSQQGRTKVETANEETVRSDASNRSLLFR